MGLGYKGGLDDGPSAILKYVYFSMRTFFFFCSKCRECACRRMLTENKNEFHQARQSHD